MYFIGISLEFSVSFPTNLNDVSNSMSQHVYPQYEVTKFLSGSKLLKNETVITEILFH